MRSTPTAGIEAILGILPLYTHSLEVSLNTAYRLRYEQKWAVRGQIGHRKYYIKILEDIGTGNLIPASRVFKVNRLTRTRPSDGADIEIYTDGSKNSKSTGYGWFIANKGIVTKEVSIPLDHLASVFMAEMSAIIQGVA